MCNVKGVAQEYTPISSHHVRKSGRRRRFCLDFGARSSLVNIGRARGSIHLAASTSTWSECLAFVKSISYVRNIHYAWLLCILDSLFTSFCRHRGALENHITHVFLCWSYADVYRSVSGGVAHSGFWYSQRTRSAMRSWRRPSSATQQKLFFLDSYYFLRTMSTHVFNFVEMILWFKSINNSMIKMNNFYKHIPFNFKVYLSALSRFSLYPIIHRCFRRGFAIIVWTFDTCLSGLPKNRVYYIRQLTHNCTR